MHVKTQNSEFHTNERLPFFLIFNQETQCLSLGVLSYISSYLPTAFKGVGNT